jgi:endoglucanase
MGSGDFTATAWGRTIWGSDEDKQNIANDMMWAHNNFTDYPMIVGEYAVSPATTEAAARWKWYDFVVRTANSYGAACMLWDAGGSFQVNSSFPWPDPTTLNIIETATSGTPNALPDSTEDGSATSQWSSAYVWHKQGESVVDNSLPMLWNGNTLQSVTCSPSCSIAGVQSGPLVAGTDYAVVGSNLTFKASFLKTLFPAGSQPGFKANLTLHFNHGADLKLMAYQYAAPTLAYNTFKVTAENQQTDLAIPITWKGRVQVAAARHIFANGTYMADTWTVWLGPLQQARMVSSRPSLLLLLVQNPRPTLLVIRGG